MLAEFIAENPGKRPWAWWQYEAPKQLRRRLGGTGTPASEFADCSPFAEGTSFGKPRCFGEDYDDGDPPRYEEEAEYLDRHGLLTPEERTKLARPKKKSKKTSRRRRKPAKSQ